MLGFINLNKPAGWTSHDCVAKVRRLLKTKRVGHGGTLDPAATGVLPIAVGKATRLLPFLPTGKVYQASIRLGIQTKTDDLTGEVSQVNRASHLTLAEIEPYLGQFIGKIKQIPPAYSAIQQGGKRLYELARDGKKVEVPARTVEVYRLEVLGWHPGEFPELAVEIACGPGTYIRAIARDLGTALHCGGTLAALERTESGGMRLAESLTLTEIEEKLAQGNFSLLPPEIALQHLPGIVLKAEEARRWGQGQKLPGERQGELEKDGDCQAPIRVQDESGQFLGIGKFIESEGCHLFVPKLVFNYSQEQEEKA